MENLTHNIPMLSLQNAYSIEDLAKWLKSVKTHTGLKDEDEVELVVEPKIDGLAVNLTYSHGKWMKALTRGDGLTGEDVSHVVSHIKFPKIIPSQTKYPLEMEIRGEIFLSEKNLEILNKKRSQNNQELYKTPRNTAVALLKSSQTSPEEASLLDYRMYEIKTEDPRKLKVYTQEDILKTLTNWGFKASDPYYVCFGNQCVKIISSIGKNRYKYDFPIDGAVLKINSLSMQQTLGATSQYPKWARAWKYPASSGTTTLKDVTWQLGRLGYFTPVGELDPVVIDGVTIKRATLHNPDYIHKKHISLNARVIVERSGDVIPAVTGVMVPLDPSVLKPIEFPKTCPYCQSELILQDTPTGSQKLKCPGDTQCPEQSLQRLYHHVQSLKIKGLGLKTLRFFYENKVLDLKESIFNLLDRYDVIVSLPGWSEKKAHSVLNALKLVQEANKES